MSKGEYVKMLIEDLRAIEGCGTPWKANKLVSMGWQKQQVINNKLEVFNVLKFCQECIDDAILSEDGLDGGKGEEAHNKIEECLRILKVKEE